jgi:hypothetical protein
MTATARPRAMARPRGSQPPGTAYQCWVDAGGGTDSYDRDRYAGLLRDRGVLRPRRGLIEILDATLRRTETATGADMAPLLIDELGKDGWRIHNVDACVRPGDPAMLGRPMSPEEERQVGIWEGA